MATQLLFGEACACLEQRPGWWRVQLLHDGYEGWLDPRMILPAARSEWETWPWQTAIHARLRLEDGSRMALPMGARIPGIPAGSFFCYGGRCWAVEAAESLPPQPHAAIPGLAASLLNVPYLWGGRSAWGIDCSGLTQLVYSICGIPLPRDSGPQSQWGRPVAYGEHLPGDLACFAQPGGTRVSHVGILAAPEQIIHASGRVRRDLFTPEGILDPQSRSLTHTLTGIRRW